MLRTVGASVEDLFRRRTERNLCFLIFQAFKKFVRSLKFLITSLIRQINYKSSTYLKSGFSFIFIKLFIASPAFNFELGLTNCKTGFITVLNSLGA